MPEIDVTPPSNAAFEPFPCTNKGCPRIPHLLFQPFFTLKRNRPEQLVVASVDVLVVGLPFSWGDTGEVSGFLLPPNFSPVSGHNPSDASRSAIVPEVPFGKRGLPGYCGHIQPYQLKLLILV